MIKRVVIIGILFGFIVASSLNADTFPNISKDELKKITSKKLKKEIQKEPLIRVDISEEIKLLEKEHSKSRNDTIMYVPEFHKNIVEIKMNDLKKIENTHDIDELMKALIYATGDTYIYDVDKRGKLSVFYIKILSDFDIDDFSKTRYFTIVKKGKNNKTICCSSKCKSNIDKAFLFYLTHRKNLGHIDFNLSALEVIELYRKLNRWNINIERINKELLGYFAKEARKIKRFDYEQAIHDLKNEPTKLVFDAIYNDLVVLNTGLGFGVSTSENILKENYLFETRDLKTVKDSLQFKGIDYTIYNRYRNSIDIKRVVNDNDFIHDFYDLKKYIDQTTDYRIRIIANKYILGKNKDVALFIKRGKQQQAKHYLNESIKEILRKKGINKKFSIDAFIADINYIERNL